MDKQITFSSTLPEKLIKELDHYAVSLKTKKNKIIEQALLKYFEAKRRNEYIESFKRAGKDKEMLTLAEEGIDDYLKLLDK